MTHGMHGRIVRALLLLAPALMLDAPGAADDAMFTGIDPAAANRYANSRALAVSPDGSTVVGYATDGAISWTLDGGLVPLGYLPGTTEPLGLAQAASEGGSVIAGSSPTFAGGPYHPFVWTSVTGMVDIGEPWGGRATDVSADGSKVVGWDERPLPNGGAFVWTDEGGMELLGPRHEGDVSSRAHAISHDGRTVVGEITSAAGVEAFRWTSGAGLVGLGDLEGGADRSAALDVSEDGSTVVGRCWGALGREQACVWEGSGAPEALGFLPDGEPNAFSTSIAHGVSGDGRTIVGTSHTTARDAAFIWTRARGMRDLGDVLRDAGLDLTGWSLTVASGISADGRVVVGSGINEYGRFEGWMARLAGTVHARVDVRPGSARNRVNPASHGVIPVALLGSADFAVADVDAATLAFGPAGTAPAHRRGGHVADVNRDGFADLLIHFRARDSGLAFGDGFACITGETHDGRLVEGCDTIETRPICGDGFATALLLLPALHLYRRRGGQRDAGVRPASPGGLTEAT